MTVTKNDGRTIVPRPGPASLLGIEGLNVSFATPRGRVDVVKDVSLALAPGKALALVGESGSGKTVTARTLVGLNAANAKVTADRLEVLGRDALALSERQWRGVRGKEIGYVLQDALVSLDPLRTVGQEIDEALRAHGVRGKAERLERVHQALRDAGIPDPELRARQRSGELSGGLRQRALIAQATVLNPQLVIADEPTTALDVTVQAQIMQLLRTLREEGQMAVILITHDLAVVAEEADSVAVMYAGNVVESGPVAEVFADPRHPYTKGLLESVPVHLERGAQLKSIPGSPPELHDIPAGCVYQSRCPLVQDICRAERPALRPAGRRRTADPAGTNVLEADDGGMGTTPADRTFSAEGRPVRTAACHFSEEITNG
jgi:oligopeptide/dipeptide ABC transporter ATP-binding protein